MTGGDTDKGDYILHQEDPNYPLLKLNQHVILFLSWNKHVQHLLLATDTPDSIYLVQEGEEGEVLRTHGRGNLANGLKEKSPEELRATLRARGGIR